MPSTFAALADQRRVAMQEGDVRHRYSTSSIVGFKDKPIHVVIFPLVITKAAVSQL